MEVHLFDVHEIAEILHISRSYAYLLISRGDIPSFRLGVRLRVHPADLEAYLSGRRRLPKEARQPSPAASLQTASRPRRS